MKIFNHPFCLLKHPYLAHDQTPANAHAINTEEQRTKISKNSDNYTVYQSKKIPESLHLISNILDRLKRVKFSHIKTLFSTTWNGANRKNRFAPLQMRLVASSTDFSPIFLRQQCCRQQHRLWRPPEPYWKRILQVRALSARFADAVCYRKLCLSSSVSSSISIFRLL